MMDETARPAKIEIHQAASLGLRLQPRVAASLYEAEAHAEKSDAGIRSAASQPACTSILKA